MIAPVASVNPMRVSGGRHPPKRPTPASGSNIVPGIGPRDQTPPQSPHAIERERTAAAFVVARETIASDARAFDAAEERDRERRRRLHGGRGEEDTPVDMPALAISRIGERTKSITLSTADIAQRVLHLETGLGETRVELGRVATQVVALDSKLDVLVDEAKEQRKERIDRERRADTRAEREAERRATIATEELKARRERNSRIIGIAVPTVAAIGAAIAGIVAATRDPSVKYVPAPPAISAPASSDGRP